jgi:hypothetical protein
MGIEVENAREHLQGEPSCGDAELQPRRKGCSRGCKICAVISGIVTLVLAMAAPIGIFVVGPCVAQHAMNLASLHISNSSIYGLPDSGIPTNATMSNMLVLNSPMFLGATLEETVVTMVADQWQVTPELGFTNGPIGNFSMPRTVLKPGDNKISFTAPIFLNLTADSGFRFVFWGFMVTQTQVARIRMVAKPKVRALGLTFHTKLEKALVCNCFAGTTGCVAEKPDPSVASLRDASGTHLVQGIATVELFCEPEGTNVWNVSDATIAPLV